MTGHLAEIPVIYIDEHLLVVNKPAGLRTITDGYDPTLPHAADLLSRDMGRVWVVHRLDKDTSGVLVFTRSPEAHAALNRQFEQRKTNKQYLALIQGQPDWDATLADLPLRTNGDRRHRTVIDPVHGKPAQTNFSIVSRFSEGLTLVNAHPLSGYTHQIRAHAAALGYPIVNDGLYGFRQQEGSPSLLISRIALHAFSITFQHPMDGRPMTIEAPLPADLAAAIATLSPQ